MRRLYTVFRSGGDFTEEEVCLVDSAKQTSEPEESQMPDDVITKTDNIAKIDCLYKRYEAIGFPCYFISSSIIC